MACSWHVPPVWPGARRTAGTSRHHHRSSVTCSAVDSGSLWIGPFLTADHIKSSSRNRCLSSAPPSPCHRCGHSGCPIIHRYRSGRSLRWYTSGQDTHINGVLPLPEFQDTQIISVLIVISQISASKYHLYKPRTACHHATTMPCSEAHSSALGAAGTPSHAGRAALH